MDASDRIRRVQGKTILRDYKTQLAKQPNVNPDACDGLADANVRYISYEYREQVRNGLATACNICPEGPCQQAPYGAQKPDNS
jgi:hypothetical protein